MLGWKGSKGNLGTGACMCCCPPVFHHNHTCLPTPQRIKKQFLPIKQNKKGIMGTKKAKLQNQGRTNQELGRCVPVPG